MMCHPIPIPVIFPKEVPIGLIKNLNDLENDEFRNKGILAVEIFRNPVNVRIINHHQLLPLNGSNPNRSFKQIGTCLWRSQKMAIIQYHDIRKNLKIALIPIKNILEIS